MDPGELNALVSKAVEQSVPVQVSVSTTVSITHLGLIAVGLSRKLQVQSEGISGRRGCMSTIKQRQEAHISRITKQGDHFQIRVRLASDYSEYETLISEEMVDASISSLYNRLGYQAVIDLPVLVDIDSDGHIYNIVGDIESFSLSQRCLY